MSISNLLNDKTIKSKEKTEILSKWLLERKIELNEVIDFAKNAKDPVKGICIEAIEYATKISPALSNKESMTFAIESLSSKAAKVKWESAKVIGNIAQLHKDQLDPAISKLLDNSEDEGTVVRWSAAFALGEIYKLKAPLSVDLKPAFEAIIMREEKNSIKKIYLDAMKKNK